MRSGDPEWLTDERFATGTGRAINARVLIGLLDEIFATRPLDEWAEAFDAEPELFWSPVNSIEDVIADEQFLAAKSVVEVPDEQSSMPMLATPADFDGEPPRPRFRAPHVGEHTREILAELKLPSDEIEALVDLRCGGGRDHGGRLIRLHGRATGSYGDATPTRLPRSRGTARQRRAVFRRRAAGGPSALPVATRSRASAG